MDMFCLESIEVLCSDSSLHFLKFHFWFKKSLKMKYNFNTIKMFQTEHSPSQDISSRVLPLNETTFSNARMLLLETSHTTAEMTF